MFRTSRRNFLKTSSATALALAASQGQFLHASPFGLPVGIQLASVPELLEKDFAGTLRRIASLGYQEVEAAGFYNHSAAEVKKALREAGLVGHSAHYHFDQMTTQMNQILEYCEELGLKYIVCSTPGFKNPARVAHLTPAQQQEAYTLDDWRWNAEQFNQFGEKVKAAGMNFCYHNHTIELHPTSNGAIPLDEMLRLTNPAVMNFQMDCGWILMGGKEPVDYLKRYPGRFVMLHVKDFKASKPKSNGEPAAATELGRGVMDYRAIFEAGGKANLKHYFV